MKIFAYEFITGGGLLRDALPDSLALEGDMMVSALLADLQRVPDVSVLAGRDPRLALPTAHVEVMQPQAGEDPFAAFVRGVRQCDAVWPVAPETGGVLAELSRIVLEEGRLLLGSSPGAVAICETKVATNQILTNSGLHCVPSFARADEVHPLPGAWVIKPDDGAGCADTCVVPGWQAARSWMDARAHEGFIAQPWIDGDALSLSMLCADGSATLLACNRQHVRVHDGELRLEGITVNALPDTHGHYAALAQRVAQALPGLHGYVGVDFIAAADGPVILEINPRLTTSYCGLREALGINPAQWVVDAARQRAASPRADAAARARSVEIRLGGHAHAH